jgi:hypothetical protein
MNAITKQIRDAVDSADFATVLKALRRELDAQAQDISPSQTSSDLRRLGDFVRRAEQFAAEADL